MQEILDLLRKIVPELVEVLEKRYNVLRTIFYNQPIGRRMLASELNLGERVVRNEIDLLKTQNLIMAVKILKSLTILIYLQYIILLETRNSMFI